MGITAVIVGGGSSSRMRGTDKLMLRIGGMSVFERSIRAFCESPEISAVVAVAREDLTEKILSWKDRYPKLCAVVPGGPTRCLSAKAGVDASPEETEFFAIHDAARPFVTEDLIARTAEAVRAYGAAAPALPVTDTIKMTEDGFSVDTPDRSRLFAVATPQMFRADLYREFILDAENSFDDCQLFERKGYKVKLVENDRSNFKITTPEDIARARMQVGDSDIRIGHGYDVHRLTEGRKLILGGVYIPWEKGLLGHSDADVLLHAICDAVLGAAALRDIGYHFPDTDPRFEGADSLKLLEECCRLAGEEGFRPVSVDATVLCQRPKLSPHIPQMILNTAAAMGCPQGSVNIKATTEEGLGFTGAGEGIAAHAVVLLARK
ncbi:MAG: 2-C-methyl-D-erythritol 2,4-cyclodiphosphate synthase [Oscillospiraceae bacterium]|nr:2-C-methyl-D-erythritol 2,4-cyclodiphosphate synthase [Oscillospiraceae bacterium]